jgi:hypothetical protein
MCKTNGLYNLKNFNLSSIIFSGWRTGLNFVSSEELHNLLSKSSGEYDVKKEVESQRRRSIEAGRGNETPSGMDESTSGLWRQLQMIDRR